MTKKTQKELLREANMRGILLVETEDGRLGINNGQIKIPPSFGSKPLEPDITKCNTVGGKSMKFGEILKAEMDKKAAEKQRLEKVISGLRFNRRFWEKIAELNAEGHDSNYIYQYMAHSNFTPQFSHEFRDMAVIRLTPKYFDYLIDEKGSKVESRIELDIYPTYQEMFDGVLKNHGVLVQDGKLEIPDDLEIPEETSHSDSSITTPETVCESNKDAYLDRIVESGNKAQELYEKISPSQDRPKSLLSKLKFWK